MLKEGVPNTSGFKASNRRLDSTLEMVLFNCGTEMNLTTLKHWEYIKLFQDFQAFFLNIFYQFQGFLYYFLQEIY